MEGDRELAPSGDVSSDTLAAWLADALGARGLLLVKSCDLPRDCADAAVLAAAGIVDPALPGFVFGRRLPLNVVHRHQWGELSQAVTTLVGPV
jgi:aspartokinase-like uncharacterized kinase